MSKWYNNDGMIQDENGQIVTILTANTEQRDIDAILFSKELLEVAEEFVADIESSSLKPKSAYKKFKSILQNVTPDESKRVQGTA